MDIYGAPNYHFTIYTHISQREEKGMKKVQGWSKKVQVWTALGATAILAFCLHANAQDEQITYNNHVG